MGTSAAEITNPPKTPLSPDELLDDVVKLRGFDSFEPRHALVAAQERVEDLEKALDSDPGNKRLQDLLNKERRKLSSIQKKQIDLSAGTGKPLGQGYKTYSKIQLLDEAGELVDYGIGVSKGNVHAEDEALADIKKTLQRARIANGHLDVAVDQDVCPRCRQRIIDFAKELDLKSVDVHHHSRPNTRNPNQSVTPKTAVRSSTQGKNFPTNSRATYRLYEKSPQLRQGVTVPRKLLSRIKSKVAKYSSSGAKMAKMGKAFRFISSAGLVIFDLWLQDYIQRKAHEAGLRELKRLFNRTWRVSILNELGRTLNQPNSLQLINNYEGFQLYYRIELKIQNRISTMLSPYRIDLHPRGSANPIKIIPMGGEDKYFQHRNYAGRGRLHTWILFLPVFEWRSLTWESIQEFEGQRYFNFGARYAAEGRFLDEAFLSRQKNRFDCIYNYLRYCLENDITKAYRKAFYEFGGELARNFDRAKIFSYDKGGLEKCLNKKLVDVNRLSSIISHRKRIEGFASFPWSVFREIAKSNPVKLDPGILTWLYYKSKVGFWKGSHIFLTKDNFVEIYPWTNRLKLFVDQLNEKKKEKIYHRDQVREIYQPDIRACQCVESNNRAVKPFPSVTDQDDDFFINQQVLDNYRGTFDRGYDKAKVTEWIRSIR